MGRAPFRHPQATRARAVQMFRDHSAREVSEELGVPEGTIRRWAVDARMRDGGKPPENLTPAQRTAWAERKEAAASDQFETMRRALRKVEEHLDAGDTSAARNAAITVGILADKSGVLEEAARQASEREARLTDAAGRLLVDVMKATFRDLGINFETAQAVLVHYLKQSQTGSKLKPDKDLAEGARSAVRTQFREEWERELPKIAPIGELPPGEPAKPKRRRRRRKPKPPEWVPADVIEAETKAETRAREQEQRIIDHNNDERHWHSTDPGDEYTIGGN